jgi:hypothetical protein
LTRAFKTKRFARFAKREGLPDKVSYLAAEAIERGLIAADLGSGVVKQRLARLGQGKFGGGGMR